MEADRPAVMFLDRPMLEGEPSGLIHRERNRQLGRDGLEDALRSLMLALPRRRDPQRGMLPVVNSAMDTTRRNRLTVENGWAVEMSYQRSRVRQRNRLSS